MKIFFIYIYNLHIIGFDVAKILNDFIVTNMIVDLR